MPPSVRSLFLLDPGQTALLVVDVQERLVPAMKNGERTVERTRRLIRGAGIFNVPVFLSEQYPKGLGPTVPELLAELPGQCLRFEKRTFSCCESEEWMRELDKTGVSRVLLCGIESHVCVLQTAMDLLTAGYAAYVATDAVDSRFKSDRRFALKRMNAAGVVLTTSESALFEWCGTADHPRFKEVGALVTGTKPNPA